MIHIKDKNKELLFDERRMDSLDLIQMLGFAREFFGIEKVNQSIAIKSKEKQKWHY